ncbi:M14 family metallopeptidase [Shewanella sp. JNE10-2]|uniref:M14 family metallopeptidase n=1 Tax=unclassified Shewanella TaxID=196818 RepID=UPI002005BB07|nr:MULTISPECIES: M14 family metallopeptidase [unclassified Shewanella]MCK7630930.1 M14 family metallopeptidase [Shewanella sp. JNE9-1]MCK7633983.1 M14 family metallopeptidase [Shewanella sp. JNE17]MCK7646183.1 M14 family metallopeptidase [Shewanella sp. JNE3-1]MCK7649208.1 M14 family metallopeptidase [Shewanella sp. JNE8]MCK7654138.1 M14 family metallopeptidase [Shewanella sp. JNE4-1]
MRLFSLSVIAIACLSANHVSFANEVNTVTPETVVTSAPQEVVPLKAIENTQTIETQENVAANTARATEGTQPAPIPERAKTFVNDAILPPNITWHGASEALMLSIDNEWATPFEQSNGIESPSYDDTILWLDRLAAETTSLQKVSLGKSPQGRDIWMYIASSEGISESASLKQNTKPTILVQAGIHAGEIDGKDAGMMLLRDIVKGNKSDLLEKANLLFVPIFSVDAHERSGEFNRVNQRGPVNMGWRTTANNLNLNRDYAKADTLEMQHMLRAINVWQPDLYIDVHVTDGIDYQYDVTFGYNLAQGLSPASYRWLENSYRPAIEAALTEQGHIPGQLIFAVDNADITKGMSLWNPSPRFSNGYGDARHLPTILVENHSLKPFKQRVLGTYVMLEQTLKTVGEQATKLKSAIQEDKYRASPLITLTWKSAPLEKGWDFKGIDYKLEKSPISGADVVRWTGEPKLYPNLPVMAETVPDLKVTRPSAYYIPAQWTQVIDRLNLHGIRMTALKKPTELKLQQYQLSHPVFSAKDFEGRQTVKVVSELTKLTTVLPEGTIKVSTDQPLGDLAVLLLEPQSPDSLLQWGFFNPIFTRTEYIEDYAVEPLAAKMLKEDPKLQAEFDKALTNPEFAADPDARLRWFYERSPYYDNQYLKYPVYRSR